MASGVALRESVKEMKRLKNEPLLMLAIIAIILFVGFFVVYPVIRVITFPSGQDYMQLFQKARWFTALKNSLFMTLISTVSCTAVAFLFAYVIARLDVPCKGLFRFVTLLPIVSPPFIVALSYILLFGVQGRHPWPHRPARTAYAPAGRQLFDPAVPVWLLPPSQARS